MGQPQRSKLWEAQFSRRRDQFDQRREFERRPLPPYYPRQRPTGIPGERRGYPAQNVAAMQRKMHELNTPSYSKPLNKPILKKVGQERRPFITSNEKALVAVRSQQFLAPAPPKLEARPALQKPIDRNVSIETKKSVTDQNKNIAKQQEKFEVPLQEKSFEKRLPVRNTTPPPNQSGTDNEDVSPSKFFRRPQTTPEERPVFGATKPVTAQTSGLLTDSLSCIFTRRSQKNSQHKVPQKRVFFEKVPPMSKDQEEKDDPISDSESTYLGEKQTNYNTPEKQCPEPPVISQATPNISNEDWFATKQRILSSVNHDPPPKSICEPQPLAQNKCPEPPQISVDPHGFDIEPPDHLGKSVSPYVPTNSCEREEYNKYKNQQLKKEAALLLAQKRYKQSFEVPSVVQEVKQTPTSYLKDNNNKEALDTSSYKEQSNYHQYERYESQPPQAQERTSSYEPIPTVSDTNKQLIAYEATQRYATEPLRQQTENIQEYEYQQSSYNAGFYEGQAQDYENVPPDYQTESTYYDQPYEPSHSRYADETVPSYEPTARQTSYENQNERDICPEAPHISKDSQVVRNELREDMPPTQEDNAPSHYPDENYGDYASFEAFKEPLSVTVPQGSNQKMCHRCSFQTTNAKKLRDHLKFVHGETTPEASPSGSQKPNELFSRREPKTPEGQNDIFLRREEVPPERNQQKHFQGRFKRRNTAAVVNIISTDIVVPARNDTGVGDNAEEKAQGQPQDPGVLAAMEYFETTKDQPKKSRPYRRSQDDVLENDWM